jgi:hypothetical protein
VAEEYSVDSVTEVTGRAEEGKLTIDALPELQIESERKVNKL